MEQLLATIPELKNYIELLPICIVGLISGVVNYYSVENKEDLENNTRKVMYKTIITSTFLCVIVYGMLTAADLPYLAKVCLSAAVGYFGIDKAIEYVQKLIALKGSRQEKTSDVKKD